ncbi:AcrB/AcrD/AcrF family protein [Colwellia sp. 75C3]|uniref:efflux RND transporter permease subunit n=1 Tax=Colwellia sp. 75C3 TaxID=888425 RepID=UPI000C3474A5|nr:efflux RND transporter permease subunit [Colwellia sp. 75C3]PKG80885.1 AcrB/AcrD/AcrF family protein [Colwellia sp. 75C3]
MITFFAKHPTASNLLMLIIIIAGLVSLPNLNRETFPEVKTNKIKASVVYPGANTEEIEQTLCLPMEEAANNVSDVEKVICEAREGIATLTVKILEGSNVSQALIDVKTEVDAIESFPELAEKPIVRELGQVQHLISLAITADIADFKLKEYAEIIKRNLKKEQGISIVNIRGFSDHQLKVELSQYKLRQYGLTVSDVARLIKRQNIKLPSGDITSEGKTILIRFDQQQLDAKSLGNLGIKSTTSGSQLKLKELANITEGFELEEEKILFDGKRAAIIDIKKNTNQDSINLVEVVKAFTSKAQIIAPEGVSLVLTQDSAQIVKGRLSMLFGNAWQGFILVFFVMWLFFSIRYSFWVSMGLPVSFLGALALMALMGVSINMISTVALLMAIGLLMDDAIVIAESIAAHVDKEGNINEGAIKGVKLVAGGVFSSFLTTFVVFVGLAFINGDVGQVLKDIPLVLIATMFVSVVEAFYILPNHLIHSLRKDKNSPKNEFTFKQAFNKRFEYVRNSVLPRWCEICIKNRYFTVGFVFAVFFVSIALMAGGILKFKSFPDLEGDLVEVKILLPPSTTLVKTEQVVAHYLTQLNKINDELTPEQPDKVELVQHTTVEFNRNSDAFEQGSHLATIRVDLLTAESRKTKLADFIYKWRDAVDEVPGILSVSFKEPKIGPAGRAIDIQLHSSNIHSLMKAATKVKEAVNKFDGVSNTMDDLRLGKEEWVVKLHPGALSLGVDGTSIANQLRAAFLGEKAEEVQRGSDNIEIYVQLQNSDKSSLRHLKNYPITLNDGSQRPLSSLAEFSLERGLTRINRVNGERTVTVTADINPEIANTSEIISMVRDTTIDNILQMYPDISVSYEGEIKNGAETGKSMGQKFLFGLIGVFIILSFQFRSYFEPIIVMLAIPLALIGVVWGHFLLGYDLAMPSMIGFISLAGIVVNDSILLVAYIKKHQTEGMNTHQAAVCASKERFRAIFITSATTIAGTLPLLLETNLQAQVVQPLVVSIIFGMSISTLLILLVLPSIYVLLEDFGLTSKHHLN